MNTYQNLRMVSYFIVSIRIKPDTFATKITIEKDTLRGCVRMESGQERQQYVFVVVR